MQRQRLIRASFTGAVAAAAALVVAVAPASSIASQRAHAAALLPCPTSGLVVWLNPGSGGGAAGSFYYTLELTNLSGGSCTLLGYPGVSGVSLSGTQIGSPASRAPGGGSSKTITLANGGTADITLRIVDVLNFPTSRCRPTTAAGLRVYPPGQKASKIVPFPFKGCSKSGTVYINVSAARAG
jgi:hypothetical protein